MRTARYAVLVAGAVLFQGLPAFAGEGSSLRGLKPPADAWESQGAVYGLTTSSAGLKLNGDDVLPVFAPRILFSGGTYTSRRFASGDYDFRLGMHRPAGQNIAALAEPSIHSLHDTLPRYTLHTHMTRRLPGGWGLGFGVRQTEYNFATTNLLALSAERSFGNFRGAYTLYSNRVEGSPNGSAHRFELSYLYGDRNTIGLAYTTGRDIDNIAPSPGLAISDVRDWTLSGRHWLSPNWALTYDVLSQEQGPLLLRRQGLRFGVSRSF
jgi:YaiO family outer membrane protein